MTPREFIQSMKARHPAAEVSEDSLPDWLVNEWKDSGQDVKDLIASVSQTDYASFLLDRLKPRLHDDLKNFLESDLVAVGVITNPEPDAYAECLNGNGYAIVFHSGLKNFVYRVARIIATRFKPNASVQGFESGGLIGESSDDNMLEETARLIAEVFWWFQETRTAFGPSYPIDEFQLKAANLLAMETETFLLAHEIGHILDIGHDSADDAILKLENGIPPGHRDEFMADIIGLILVMELNNPGADRDLFNTPFIYAGVEFALQIWQALECVGFEIKGSHPSATDRLQRIRSEMQSRCKDAASWNGITSLSRGIDSIMRQIVEIIQDPGEHAAFFEREANRVLSELDYLLDQHTGGMLPNYIEFYGAVSKIFERGYSHKMLERMADVAAAFYRDANSPDVESTSSTEAWVRFQKYKLLYGYVTNMNEPAKSLFMNAFEDLRSE